MRGEAPDRSSPENLAGSASARLEVLVVAPEPFYEDRGTPIAVGQLVAALAKLGYQVDVLAYPIGTNVDLPNVRLMRSPDPLGLRSVPIGFSLKKLWLDAGMLLTLHRLLRRRKYVVVHAIEEMILPALLLCRLRGVPVIYDMQSSLPDQLRTHAIFRPWIAQQFLRRLERFVLIRVAAVVCSAGLGSYVGSIAPAAKVTEWRFAGQQPAEGDDARTRLRAELGISANSRVVLYTGTFEPYQGLDMLVDAMPAVIERDPSCMFVLIGATADENLARRAVVRALMRSGSLLVLSRQPRSAIPAYLTIADALVSPRMYGDNVPLKIFEYMLSGKPIVATDLPAHRSVLIDGTALLVERNPQALAAGLIRVLHDPTLASALSQAALRVAGGYPGGESFVDLVRELYAGTIRPRSEA